MTNAIAKAQRTVEARDVAFYYDRLNHDYIQTFPIILYYYYYSISTQLLPSCSFWLLFPMFCSIWKSYYSELLILHFISLLNLIIRAFQLLFVLPPSHPYLTWRLITKHTTSCFQFGQYCSACATPSFNPRSWKVTNITCVVVINAIAKSSAYRNLYGAHVISTTFSSHVNLTGTCPLMPAFNHCGAQ